MTCAASPSGLRDTGFFEDWDANESSQARLRSRVIHICNSIIDLVGLPPWASGVRVMFRVLV